MRVFLTVQSNGESKEYIMALTQLWQQEGGAWKIIASQRSNPAPRPTIRLTEPTTTNPDLYPDANEAQKDLDCALAAAAKDHKNVIVVFGGNWCYDCHVLDATFKTPAIAPLLKSNYHVVHINIGEYDQNLAIAAKYQTVLTHGVPALAVLDDKGKLLTSQKNGEFESAVKIGPSDITDFLNQWRQNPRSAGCQLAFLTVGGNTEISQFNCERPQSAVVNFVPLASLPALWTFRPVTVIPERSRLTPRAKI